jgi:hypothetical protein
LKGRWIYLHRKKMSSSCGPCMLCASGGVRGGGKNEDIHTEGMKTLASVRMTRKTMDYAQITPPLAISNCIWPSPIEFFIIDQRQGGSIKLAVKCDNRPLNMVRTIWRLLLISFSLFSFLI